MNIRPYQKKDFRYVQDICMATSKHSDSDTPENRAYLCALYCDYYLDNQAEFCFVAVDEEDIPIGYILCAADATDYEENMQQLYLPLVRKVASGEYFRFAAESRMFQQYVSMGYTAHLHINVLPDYQRQGLGTKLLDTVEQKLKELFVEGVYLVCARNNADARKFYESRGFEDIDYPTGLVVYGKKFFKED